MHRFHTTAAVAGLTLACGWRAPVPPLQPEPTVDGDARAVVLVSARALAPGVVLAEDNLVATAVPSHLVPDGAFASPDHVVGRKPHGRILAHELVRAERLDTPVSGGLHVRIPEGMRAVEVPAGGVTLTPGQYVDAWRQSDRPCAVAQGAFVLAVDHDTEPVPAAGDTVSLMLLPADVGAVLSVAGAGQLRLTPRDDDDLTERPEARCSP